MKELLLAALLILLTTAAGAADRELYVYNWTEYLPYSVIQSFSKETGIKVHYSTYDSNETMYAKLKMLGGKGYDLVVPSSYFVDRMRREGLLRKLDKSRIPNIANLDPNLLDRPHDPENDFSVPYLWGTTGIGYNPALVNADEVRSYGGLWSEKFKGRLVLTNDLREVFGMALLVRGYPINDTDEAHIHEAYELLRRLWPNVLVFNSDSPRMPFINREVIAGLVWNSEAVLAEQEVGPGVLAYSYPGEGVLAWMDNLCIPAGAENADEAHEFINFLLRPDNAAEIMLETGFAAPNPKAIAKLPAELRTNTALFPPAEVMSTARFAVDIGDSITVYEKYWEKLKTGQ